MQKNVDIWCQNWNHTSEHPLLKVYLYFNIINVVTFLIGRCNENGFDFKESEQDMLMRRILTEQITL